MRIFVFGLVALLLTGCGDVEPAKNIRDVSSNVEYAVNKDGWVLVSYKTNGRDGGEDDVASMAHDIFKISKWQMTHGGGVENGIAFAINIPTKDKHGNVGSQAALFLRLPGADLARINWDNFVHWDLMNLADFEPTHAFGQKIIATWCLNEDNLKYSRSFCGQLFTKPLNTN